MFIIIPNLNRAASLLSCLKALVDDNDVPQKRIIVVDNNSSDDSVALVSVKYPSVIILEQDKNYGFAKGVNIGIKKAIAEDADFVALINNDAIPGENWLSELESTITKNDSVGIVASKMVSLGKIDSVGEEYSIWGTPFPTRRGKVATSLKLSVEKEVFAASGGASLYRVEMFEEIGLFDEDFFAYYEDVDISFRARLAGWKVMYNPKAVVEHEVGATSSKMPGFTTYQHFKNLPMLLVKNLPLSCFVRVLPRFVFAYSFSFIGHLARGESIPTIKGMTMGLWYLPKKIWQRWQIQSKRKVEPSEIWELLYKDMPPNARALRKVRSTLIFWRSYE